MWLQIEFGRPFSVLTWEDGRPKAPNRMLDASQRPWKNPKAPFCWSI
jgi:hypothetical protein